ncbi:hypothetical protein [Aureivirga marina]|uniref:hypothetical protein n=1 Tax=Aureivirga marina TaxID=1182451 RepID=UPI0018CBB8CD|nr:hypothetical protein [Aureivirga marina]
MKTFFKIIFNFFTILVLCLFFGACTILDKGFINHNGQYVPKNPNFKLKNKQGNMVGDIDTLAIYKMVEMYNNGKLIYPLNNSENELNSVSNFIKFYNNGRCLIFSIPVKNAFGKPNKLKKSDLNPNNQHHSKSYYYSSNGKNVQIESFIYGDGQGYYVTTNYIFSESKDTLIMQEKYIKIVYKKESIPLNWSGYKKDW